MTHRADQILDAAVAAIESVVGGAGVKVYKHRRLSLGVDQDELPAISVDFGEDAPAADLNTQFIDSTLTLEVTGVVYGYEEAEVKAALLKLRREAHQALMADDTLGLAFVFTTFYGGAEAPEIDADGEYVIGKLTAPWRVQYRMNRSDPGD